MEIGRKKMVSFFDDLTKSEIQELMRDAKQGEIIKSVPVVNYVGEDSESFSTFWLHARINRDSYYFCSTYSYHVWATTDKAGKEKVEVEQIRLRVRRNAGDTDYTKVKNNTSEFRHIDEVYGKDNICGNTVLTATAKLFGSTWVAEIKL